MVECSLADMRHPLANVAKTLVAEAALVRQVQVVSLVAVLEKCLRVLKVVAALFAWM